VVLQAVGRPTAGCPCAAGYADRVTTTQLFLILAALWVAIGVTASFVMGRRGHSSFTWLLLGAVLGPLVIPIGMSAVRAERRHPRAQARLTQEGERGSGTVDVLVGIDGSVQSAAALRAALDLLGDRIGRLTLAGVIDYDSAISGRPWDTERLAIDELGRLAATVEDPKPSMALLVGDPAAALARHAAEDGYELLVVGRRGHGASKALLGSTAMKLGRGTDVPVLIV
jgi:nucleotide-binding universal stress UspA family protein